METHGQELIKHLDDLVELLAMLLETNPSGISESTPLSQFPSWDSLTRLELVFSLGITQNHTEIEQEMAEAENPGELLKIIRGLSSPA